MNRHLPDRDDSSDAPRRVRSLLAAIAIVISLVGCGYLLATWKSSTDQREVESTEFDDLVVALRESTDRLEVQKLSGEVTTIANALGGWGKILHGEMKVKQPWTVSYFINMEELGLDDYIWDAPTRTLLVRAPSVRPDAPNIDETKQTIAYRGPIITRTMQTQLRQAVANGARKQVNLEASKPEHLEAAAVAARKAIARNLKGPLVAVGMNDVHIVVQMPSDAQTGSSERWDVSRSIAEVLAERAQSR